MRFSSKGFRFFPVGGKQGVFLCGNRFVGTLDARELRCHAGMGVCGGQFDQFTLGVAQGILVHPRGGGEFVVVEVFQRSGQHLFLGEKLVLGLGLPTAVIDVIASKRMACGMVFNIVFAGFKAARSSP